MIDYLIVGAGITGATLARELVDAGKSVLVMDKRDHIGGNCYTETIGNTIVSKYGGHIFHTNSFRIWGYVQQFSDWQQYEHRVKVTYDGVVYSFPPNLMTYQQLGLMPTPEADNVIRSMFFDGYTAKQWGGMTIPESTTKRIPFRHTWDDRYFDDKYQGLPEGGYTPMIERMLAGAAIELGRKADWRDFEQAKTVIYTGPLDELYGYEYGRLEYRSLNFDTLVVGDYDQGCATMNYAEQSIPYTRVMQWRYFWRTPQPANMITWEYPAAYTGDNDPYYPICTVYNMGIHSRYENRLPANVINAGRLGEYRYYNMDQAIGAALALAERLIT